MTAGNILVCVDGSDYTEPSLLHAVWLGECVGASKLVVTHIADVGKYQVPFVNELGAGIGLQPCNGLFGEIYKQEQALLVSLKERVEVALKDAGWSNRHVFVVGKGRPTEALSLPELQYSHVVMGKRGDGFVCDQDELGSNLWKFLKYAEVPCLLSSRCFRPIHKIGFVLSETQEWREVLKFLDRFVANQGQELHLIHSIVGSEWDVLQGTINRLELGGVKVISHRSDSISDSRLISMLSELRVDALILGAQKESHLFHWLGTPLGKSIIKSCRIPILLCRG